MIKMISGYICKLPRFLSYLFSVLLIGTYMLSAVSPVGAVSPIKKQFVTVGFVDAVRGKVLGTPPGDPKSIKSIGDTVVKNETISTGYKSSMTMTFIDKTVLKLGADAKITIDEMVYDPANEKDDSVIFKLGTGAFYFISGKVAKQKVTLITPTATIGIRGTELIIHVDSDGATSVGVTKGRAFMRSRENGSSNEIDLGSTGRSDGKGNVSESRKGIDLTGDEGIDRNVDGVSDWLGEDEKKKEQDYTEFSSENPENSDVQDENGDANGDAESNDGAGDTHEADQAETDGAESYGGDGEGGDAMTIEGESGGESGAGNSGGEGDGTDSGDGTDGGDGSNGGSGLDSSSGSDSTSSGSSGSSEGSHD